MPETSYEWQNLKRDLTDELEIIVTQQPTLLSVIGIGGGVATQTKHEWNEDSIAPDQSVIQKAGGYDSLASVLKFKDVRGFMVDQIIAADGSEELMKVEEIDKAAKELTVQRGFGASTPEAIADETLVRVISRPRLEGTPKGKDAGQQPRTAHNFTQIFDRNAFVTGTGQAVKKYGIGDALNYQVNVHNAKIAQEINKTLIYGRKVEGDETIARMAGGLMQFIREGGNVVDAAGEDLGSVIVNDLMERIFLAGGQPVTLLCATNQARKFSALNGNSANMVIARQDQVAGSVVYEFQGDLPVGGALKRIVVDPSMPKDTVIALDQSRVKVVPLEGRALHDMDATEPGMDGYQRRLLGEYTNEIKNAAECHGMIRNLKA